MRWWLVVSVLWGGCALTCPPGQEIVAVDGVIYMPSQYGVIPIYGRYDQCRPIKNPVLDDRANQG